MGEIKGKQSGLGYLPKGIMNLYRSVAGQKGGDSTNKILSYLYGQSGVRGDAIGPELDMLNEQGVYASGTDFPMDFPEDISYEDALKMPYRGSKTTKVGDALADEEDPDSDSRNFTKKEYNDLERIEQGIPVETWEGIRGAEKELEKKERQDLDEAPATIAALNIEPDKEPEATDSPAGLSLGEDDEPVIPNMTSKPLPDITSFAKLIKRLVRGNK